MQYYHTDKDGYSFYLPAGKFLWMGRHYGLHAQELNNPVPARIHGLNVGDEIKIGIAGHLTIRPGSAAPWGNSDAL